MAQAARTEHPKPQMQRENWQNLNGEWDFAFDFGCSGVERRFYERDRLDRKIQVPFCPESDLSGIGYKDFIPAVWYQKKVELTKEQLEGHVRLHFGAVDYECRLWVNGQEAGTHRGGYVSFSFDITKYAKEGVNTLTLYARDDTRSGRQCKGKQSGLFHSQGCDYTRTTGIWQISKNYTITPISRRAPSPSAPSPWGRESSLRRPPMKEKSADRPRQEQRPETPPSTSPSPSCISGRPAPGASTT